MGSPTANQYRPDAISPPGETLEEVLEERGMTQAELAERTGRPKKTINEIIQDKAAITPETALQLERVLGTPASFWLKREQQYREFLARQHDQQQLAQHVDWLDQMPVKAMITLHWIAEYANPVDQLREVLAFFGIASPDQWDAVKAAFRRSTVFASNEMALAAWLRQGERLAQAIDCLPFKPETFRAALQQARALSCEPVKIFLQQLPQLCAPAGVAVMIVPELPQTRVCGATRWVSSNKALLQLSLRYRSDDQFWFSFFHEAGHILLHGKRNGHLDEEARDQTEQETEANRFAADMLIPPEALREFLRRRDNFHISRDEIEQFAAKVGIAPGIVVGRFQHDNILSRTRLNSLKRSLI